MKKLLLAMALCLLLTGCADRIDGSSAEKFDKSFAAMTEGMTAEERRGLELYMLYITADKSEFTLICADLFMSERQMLLDAGKRCHGMTLEEIVKEARKTNE